ncbi:MAG: hypothetical protein LBT47_11555 [Deltaproteobacteria bacterium]|nr:hypothetical protein [Deltaproteobacteria bacterium]
MPVPTYFSIRVAKKIQNILTRTDIRLLVALGAASGLASWLGPIVIVPIFLTAGLPIFWAAIKLKAVPRSVLTAYIVFVILWTSAQFCLSLIEHPEEINQAAWRAFYLGARLTSIVSLALIIPLAATPLKVGRAISWYLEPGAALWSRLRRSKNSRAQASGAWQVSLGLTLMMSFLPRVCSSLTNLNRSLKLRAPQLSAFRRIRLLGLALLRIIGTQTWEVALAIAGRNLYRPEPWIWPKKSGPAQMKKN